MLRYEIVKHMVLELLISYTSGEKIPSRNELCRKLVTSRMTLDKALKELESEGYLHSVKGGGTYICKDPPLLGGAKQEQWGVLVPDIQNTTYAKLIRGIENVAEKYNINVILCNTDDDAQKQELYISRLINSGIAGLIVVPIIADNIVISQEMYRSVINAAIPMVFCNREVDGIEIPTVKTSDFYGGYIATKHLLKKGYRHIAYIATTRFRTSFERCQGYICALMEYGLMVDRRLIYIPKNNNSRLSAEQAAEMILDCSPEIDSFFAFNDMVAKSVCDVLKTRGKRISDQVGVIGFIDMPICEEYVPKLSSVTYRTIEIGEKAAEILKKMIHKQPLSGYNQYIFEPYVVERESCLGKR